MTYSVRKSESGSGWDIVETSRKPDSNAYTRQILRKFNYRHEARDWLRGVKEGRWDIDGDPKHDNSVWRNAATPIADNH